MGETSVAVFDLDGTITRRDTYVQFLLFCLRSMPQRLLRIPLLVVYLIIHKVGLRSNHWLKAIYLRTVVGGVGGARLEDLCEKFYQSTMANNIKQGALAELAELRGKGYKIVIATASFDFYVYKVANALLADEVLCTVAELDKKGCVTGNIAGRNCLGEEKASQVMQLISSRGWSGVNRAYSDDKVDLPLLNMAEIALVVDPKPATEMVAGKLGYKILRWKQAGR